MTNRSITPQERKEKKTVAQRGLRQMYREHGIKVVHWWRSNGRHKWNYEISFPGKKGMEVIGRRKGVNTKMEALSLAQRWIDARWRMLDALEMDLKEPRKKARQRFPKRGRAFFVAIQQEEKPHG